ncbi:Plant self-incompatibility S1 [Corchorus olitorius]|uniref:S-protein homolog n=1 Tax=Corchorus olitorius TaxID=93759 RepID=A0A1R3GIX0_9ROSI|nr:Plant self-incompatibility S1 [Corchorus olitorius]
MQVLKLKLSSMVLILSALLPMSNFLSITPSTPVAAAASPPAPKYWTVHIVNELGPGKILTIHCKSNDHDLPVHKIPFGKEEMWSFSQLKPPHYFCYLANGNRQMNFDVPTDRPLYLATICNIYRHCLWVVKENGLYLRNVPHRSGYDVFTQGWKQ